MLLAIDIGNTNIVWGVFDGAKLLADWRVGTDHSKTTDEYGILLLDLLRVKGISPDRADTSQERDRPGHRDQHAIRFDLRVCRAGRRARAPDPAGVGSGLLRGGDRGARGPDRSGIPHDPRGTAPPDPRRARPPLRPEQAVLTSPA